MSKKGRVLVAMSGGVDSSVTALLLHQQGYEVIGITMKTWSHVDTSSNTKETGCCTLDSINDARELAVRMNFPHYILDIKSEFGDAVIDNFVAEYMAGRTPNPCILCNTHIKWDALIKRANKLDCEYIATGHYAKINKKGKRYFISKGKDISKDQSYVLWGLSQANLARTFFPLHTYSKDEIRTHAHEMGFANLAKKKDSYEICFIPDNDYRGFIKKRTTEKIERGKFVFSDGTEVGEHEGYPFYTIGQRKGLNTAIGEPLYVKEIRPKTNTIVLGKKDELFANKMTVRDINLMKYDNISADFFCQTKIRYRNQGTDSIINHCGGNIEVQFLSPVSAITPGQSAVFYEGDDVVGGGFIEKEIS